MRKRGSSGWLKNAAGQFVGAADGWHRLEDFPPQGERPAVAEPELCQPFYWEEKQQLFKKSCNLSDWMECLLNLLGLFYTSIEGICNVTERTPCQTHSEWTDSVFFTAS